MKQLKIAALLFFLSGMFFIGNAWAQAPFEAELSTGVKVNFATGALKEINSFGVGFDLQGEFPLSHNFSAVANTGLSFLLGRDSDEGTYDGDHLGFIPFMGGARYYIAQGIFIGGQAGYGMYQNGFLSGPSSGGFSFAPQIGINNREGKTSLYLFYNSTNLKNESDFIPTGQIAHIGGSLIYRP